MSIANTLNIEMDQGSTLSYTFTLKNTNAAPLDLTGFDARLQVRTTYGSTTPIISATLSNLKLALSAPTMGQLVLTLAPADTSSIRFLQKDDSTLDAVYDLELVAPTGKVYKPCKGSFTLNREVTR